MIDALSFLVTILVCIGSSHVLLPYDSRMRLFWCSAPGALLLFIVHPLALMLALLSFVFCTCIYFAGRYWASKHIATRIPYLILSLLLVPDFTRLLIDTPILWLGSAFFIIRQMMTVTQGIKQSSGPEDFLAALTLSTFFFAALPAGPVFNGMKCWHSLKENKPPDYSEGCYRLFEGFVYLFAVTGFIALLMKSNVHDVHQMLDSTATKISAFSSMLIAPVASFCLLFTSFYGYSRIAEGTALLFGFEVPKNFNKPYLARDLGDFWQRWHRSMADFVMQYVYLPLLVSGLSTRLSLILAFTFMGFWHNLSWSFLVWGIGHGIGLAYFLPWARKNEISPLLLRLVSLFYVITLSDIAHGSTFK